MWGSGKPLEKSRNHLANFLQFIPKLVVGGLRQKAQVAEQDVLKLVCRRHRSFHSSAVSLLGSVGFGDADHQCADASHDTDAFGDGNRPTGIKQIERL